MRVGAPSELGTGVLLGTLAATGVSEDSPIHTEAGACSLMGYACRMAQDDSSKNDYSHVVEPHIARDSTGAVDLEQMRSEGNDQFLQLVEQVAQLADSTMIAWESSTTMVSAEAWDVFSAFATYALHMNLLGKGLPRAALIPEDGMENLMRLGYVIRLVDEAAGLSPLMKISSRMLTVLSLERRWQTAGESANQSDRPI